MATTTLVDADVQLSVYSIASSAESSDPCGWTWLRTRLASVKGALPKTWMYLSPYCAS